MMKYKLRIKMYIPISKTKVKSMTRSVVWDNIEDALACKALLEKGEIPNNTTVSFVEFTEEKELK